MALPTPEPSNAAPVPAPLVSVIVPVYNAVPYLEAAVQCLLAQELRDFELILVDDGSTDSSGELCDAFARQDSRVRVIHQKNGGAAAARNTGLDVARGAWIAFVDQDDLVGPTYLQALLDAALTYDAEMAIAMHLSFAGEAPRFPRDSVENVEVVSGRDVCLRTYEKGPFNFDVVTARIQRREVYEHLRFPLGTAREDAHIAHELAWPRKRVALCWGITYGYRQTPGGVTRQPFGKGDYDSLDALDARVAYFERVGDEELMRRAQELVSLWRMTVGANAILADKADQAPEKWRMETGEVLRELARHRDSRQAMGLLARVLEKLRESDSPQS